MRERFYSRNIKISRSHVSIAGEFHLRKIALRLISIETIRFATDEILYHVGALIFSRTFARSRTRGFSPKEEKEKKKDAASLFMQIPPALLSRFRFRAERKTRAGS